MTCAFRFRVFPTVACPQVPGFFACRFFSVSHGSRMACASRCRVCPTSRVAMWRMFSNAAAAPKRTAAAALKLKVI